MENFFVYQHTREDTNEIFYIGIGSHHKKWKHARAHTKRSRNIHWKRIVEKNNGNFIVEILFDNVSQQFACDKEIELIKLYGRRDLKLGSLCNLRDGGEGGFNLSEESKKKIGDKNRGINSFMFGKKHSEEWKRKMSERMSGKNNHNFGKVFTKEERQVQRLKRLGKKASQETIQKMRESRGKKILDTENNIIYRTISEVAIKYNFSPQHMTRLIKKNMFNLKFL